MGNPICFFICSKVPQCHVNLLTKAIAFWIQIWLVPMAGNRFGWGVTTTLPPPPDSQLPNKSVDSDDNNNNNNNNNNTNNHRRSPTERASLESKFNLRTSPSKHHYRHHSADFDFYLATSTPPSSPVESYKPEFPLSGQVSPRSLSKKTSRRDVKSTYSAGYEPNLRSEPLYYSSSLGRPSGEAVAIARLPYASTSTTRPSFQHKTSMATGGASGSKGAPVQPFTLHSANTTSNRTWRRLDEMLTVDGSIRHQPSPHGGTLGDLVDSTSRKMISVVVVEEKFYHTWHHGRSILIGDGMSTAQAV